MEDQGSSLWPIQKRKDIAQSRCTWGLTVKDDVACPHIEFAGMLRDHLLLRPLTHHQPRKKMTMNPYLGARQGILKT